MKLVPPCDEDDENQEDDKHDRDDDADEDGRVVGVGFDGLRPVRLRVLVAGRVGADLEPVGRARFQGAVTVARLLKKNENVSFKGK